MGLVTERPRWALYKCFSCRHVVGQFAKELTRDELEVATMEMDTIAQIHLDEKLSDIRKGLEMMSSEELNNFFGRNDQPEEAQAQAKINKAPHDWLSAIQSYEFKTCQIINNDGEWTCIECVGKYGTYRAFYDELGTTFKLQWIISHPSIGHFKKQERDDLVMQITKASSGVEIDFNVNMARLCVKYIGFPDDYYLSLEKSVRELESVIPTVLSIFGKQF